MTSDIPSPPILHVPTPTLGAIMNLPSELLNEITGHLEPRDLLALTSVNNCLRNFALWRLDAFFNMILPGRAKILQDQALLHGQLSAPFVEQDEEWKKFELYCSLSLYEFNKGLVKGLIPPTLWAQRLLSRFWKLESLLQAYPQNLQQDQSHQLKDRGAASEFESRAEFIALRIAHEVFVTER
ncbi:hypothetical protein BGX26_009781 [Mortierella sp. AD094]|nr:hypothetical protein BGX26_009781 [Mortierella sp. AD094]